MASTALYKLNQLVTPAGAITGLQSRDIDMGIVEYVLKNDGRISPTFYANMAQRPSFRASTVAISSALTALGLGFYAFAAPVELYIAKLMTGGGLAGTLAHAKIAGSKGCIVPERLVAAHGRAAVLDFRGYWLSADGVAAPITYTGSVSLPAVAGGAEAFTVGMCRINASTLAGLRSFEIDFGYDVLVHDSGGDLYPTFACYQAFSPRITFSTVDAALIATIGVNGVAQSVAIGETPSRFFLQKLAPAGRVAAATAAHVKFGLTAGFIKPTTTSETDEGETEQAYEVVNLDDATNAILSVAAGVAIA